MVRLFFRIIILNLTALNAHASGLLACSAASSALSFVEDVYKVAAGIAPVFQHACKDDESVVDIANRPATPFFQKLVPMVDEDGNKSQIFLRMLVQKIRSKVLLNRNQATTLRDCLQSKESVCTPIHNWVVNALPAAVVTARSHLAVAQGDVQLVSLVGKTNYYQNWRLDSYGSPKLVKWKTATVDELTVARKTLAGYECYANEVVGATKESAERTFRGMRYMHFRSYQALIAKLPIMQYLDSPNPTIPEIFNASKAILSGLDKETKMVDKWERAIDGLPFDDSSLNLMMYSSLVEELLLENPEFCAIATSLHYSQQNHKVRDAAAVALPLIAVSIAAPPLAVIAGTTAGVGTAAATGLGLASGVGLAAGAQKSLSRERIAHFSAIYGSLEDYGSVQMAQESRDWAIAFLPLGLGAVGGAKGALSPVLRTAMKGVRAIPMQVKVGAAGAAIVAVNRSKKLDPIAKKCGLAQ